MTPEGVAIHPRRGDMYVTDTYISKICIFHYDGTFVLCTGTWVTAEGGSASVMLPYLISITPDGGLIITDYTRVTAIQGDIVIRVWGNLR
jgi:hypothetical protein